MLNPLDGQIDDHVGYQGSILAGAHDHDIIADYICLIDYYKTWVAFARLS